MAGRGTDIVLGGKKEDQSDTEWAENNEKVLLSGGLHILGTERHESRRIDNQLRGRSGRQGDPGFTAAVAVGLLAGRGSSLYPPCMQA